MSILTIFSAFIERLFHKRKISFSVSLSQPNIETEEAMLEAEMISTDSSVKGYDDLDEMFADLESTL